MTFDEINSALHLAGLEKANKALYSGIQVKDRNKLGQKVYDDFFKSFKKEHVITSKQMKVVRNIKPEIKKY